MRYLLAAALFAVTASVGSAATLLVETTDTVGFPALKTYRFSIETAGGETFRGVDATFTGAMNQINPAGQSTVFQDANGFFGFVGADVSQDSQFGFASSTLLQIGGAESASLLKAAISGLADNGLSNPAYFAQIVTADPAGVQLNLAFDIGQPEPFRVAGVTIQDLLVPEPTTCVLAGLALVGAAARRRV